jgi:peptide/nickel transport system ATP-binding protein
MSSVVLSVRNLSVTLQTACEQVQVVDRLSFSLHSGEILGLVGESGCGKSITAAALMGLIPPMAGKSEAEQIQLGEIDLTELDEAGQRRIRGSGISMVFQEPLTALDPVFTIGSQLSTVIRRHRGESRRQARDSAIDMLNRVGMADARRMMKSYPHQLSGGMRQRVMIAMAMACQPTVLIADEPTSALDVTTQTQILEQLRELGQSFGTAILLITHDLGVVAQACDRALVMYCGRIVEEAPVGALFSEPAHPYTAGLLAAVPRISGGEVQRVRAIPGKVPLPAELPAGCHFAARCSRTDDRCREQSPELRNINNPGGMKDSGQESIQRVACHHPLPPSPAAVVSEK